MIFLIPFFNFSLSIVIFKNYFNLLANLIIMIFSLQLGDVQRPVFKLPSDDIVGNIIGGSLLYPSQLLLHGLR